MRMKEQRSNFSFFLFMWKCQATRDLAAGMKDVLVPDWTQT